MFLSSQMYEMLLDIVLVLFYVNVIIIIGVYSMIISLF